MIAPLIDNDGNRLWIVVGAYGEHEVMLYLVKLDEERTIALLRGQRLTICRPKKTQYFNNMGGGWAFNMALLERHQYFGYTEVFFSAPWKGIYKVCDVRDMLKHIKPMKFKEQGFERQGFLPESYFRAQAPFVPEKQPQGFLEFN